MIRLVAHPDAERGEPARRVRLLGLRWTADRPGSEWWLGGLLAIGLMIGARLAEEFSGPLKTPHASFEARLPYTLAIAVGYILAAYSYAIRRCEQDFDALRPSLRCSEQEFRGMRDSLSHHDRRLVPAAGVAAVLLTLVIQEALSQRFTRIFVTGDWNILDLWIAGSGVCLWWMMFQSAAASFLNIMTFRRTSNALLEIDLFERDLGAPIVRFGLRTIVFAIALPLVLFAVALARGAAAPSVAIPAFIANVVLGGLALGLPTSGLRRRIREAKRLELERVDRAVRGDRAALAESRVASEAQTMPLLDLLQYRREVADVREWPFDAWTRGRFAFYMLLPPASWLAAAMVERLLDLALDR